MHIVCRKEQRLRKMGTNRKAAKRSLCFNHNDLIEKDINQERHDVE